MQQGHALKRDVEPERIDGTVATPAVRTGSGLELSRTDIRFRLHGDGTLALQVRLQNPLREPSAPQTACVELAPFGAFLPGTPVGNLAVPSLAAGETRTLRETIRVPQLALGGFGEPPWGPTPFTARRPGALSDLLRDLFAGARAKYDELRHVAGNVHLYFGRALVERHLSGPLRIYPGLVNVGFFRVGSGTDAYRIWFGGDGRSWRPMIENLPDFVEGEWYEGSDVRKLAVSVMPPRGCRGGSLDVFVEQRSTSRVAVVEFTLASSAS